MRPIEYRAWHPASKRMYDWNYLRTHRERFLSDAFVWLEYLGITDKNRVKIFESDIVRGKPVNNKHYIVFYYDACWLMSATGKVPSRQVADYKNEIEVIGNIYQHPHLIDAVK